MKNKLALKVLSLVCSVTVIMSVFAGCTKKKNNSEELSGNITVWAWNEELITSGIIEEFEKAYPGIKVDLVNVPNTDSTYANKLVATLKSGVNAPDVFLSEAGNIERIKKINACENLSNAPYNAESLTKNMVPYTVDAGKDKNGSVIALTWQATPGGFFYRRSIAKKYFGTDDPQKIQSMMNTMDDFVKLGESLRDKSNGEISLLASKQELMHIALASRKNPWVKDNKIIIDPEMEKYIDISKEITDKKVASNIGQWSTEWSEAMADGNVFGFILPTWGISDTIPGNAPNTKGDWAFVKAPAPYFWGGTWISIYKGSCKKDLSWAFVKFITTNEKFLEKYAKDKGDFVNNKTIQHKIADSNEGNNSFLNGQNPYKTYIDMVDSIDFSNTTEYDDDFNNMWMEAIDDYLNGKISRDEVENEFKNKVISKYPDLKA